MGELRSTKDSLEFLCGTRLGEINQEKPIAEIESKFRHLVLFWIFL